MISNFDVFKWRENLDIYDITCESNLNIFYFLQVYYSSLHIQSISIFFFKVNL